MLGALVRQHPGRRCPAWFWGGEFWELTRESHSGFFLSLTPGIDRDLVAMNDELIGPQDDPLSGLLAGPL